ncbi:MAG: dihydropteroate synthase [Bacteroidales bacterium]|nr:dihydropteroate synthase [Bacteroidales bacterium]
MSTSEKIMGIVNINGDSFYNGSRVSSVGEFCTRVEKLFADGADVVDIGACSSRPGSVYPGVAEEWQRLEPMLKIIRERYLNSRPGEPGRTGIRFSIDTFSSEIVKRAYDIIGPFIVNDITAGQSDAALLPLVAKLKLPYIAMHNLNPPAIAGQRRRMIIRKKENENVVDNVKRFFRAFEKRAATAGIGNWILDPGYGFGKDVEQNLELLDRQDELLCFGREILAGISRKRMTYERQGTKPEDAGTLAETRRLQKIAVERGATWLRVHDI